MKELADILAGWSSSQQTAFVVACAMGPLLVLFMAFGIYFIWTMRTDDPDSATSRGVGIAAYALAACAGLAGLVLCWLYAGVYIWSQSTARPLSVSNSNFAASVAGPVIMIYLVFAARGIFVRRAR